MFNPSYTNWQLTQYQREKTSPKKPSREGKFAPNSLYLVLRSEEHRCVRKPHDRYNCIGEWQWCLFVFVHNLQENWIYAIDKSPTLGTRSATSELIPTKNILHSRDTICAIRVGEFTNAQLAQVHQDCRADENKLNEFSIMRSQAWIFLVCQRLKASGIMRYGTWAEVEKEAGLIASIAIEATPPEKLPKRKTFSKICGMTHG
jgi:hypothetical protein